MRIAKRVFLFILVNILVVTTISIVLSVLGVRPYLTQNGIDYNSLMIFCLVWGFGGAFISLSLSRIMAKWMMGVKVIDPNQASGPELTRLVNTVHRLAASAGIQKMPEVGYYESDEVNAFATGPTKNRALVAVSTGLLRRMEWENVEGVLGHEVAHISNGDMVTMTLIQGVINSFVMFFARIIAYAISLNVREENQHTVRFVVTIVLDILLSLLGAMVVAYFSRIREFRADKGGAQLAGHGKMIGALSALRRATETVEDSHPSYAALKINSRPGGLMALLSSHPPLEERISRLQQGA
jgi:heat shock protein HtpX